MEYTLEDTLETLKEIQLQQQDELEDLQKAVANNEIASLNSSITSDDVKAKQEALSHYLLMHVQRETPRNYPLPKTADLQVDLLKELENQITAMEDLKKQMEAERASIQEDIVYLESKKIGLDNMREICSSANESIAKETFEKEYRTTKELFQKVKEDLEDVVNILFPDNSEFKKLLADLTSAYMKGGDDVYVDVSPGVIHYVHFLAEADIISYHRNDKSKIRLTDLL